ncbi:hypothetical protein RYX36_005746 [Vicia faba]
MFSSKVICLASSSIIHKKLHQKASFFFKIFNGTSSQRQGERKGIKFKNSIKSLKASHFSKAKKKW